MLDTKHVERKRTENGSICSCNGACPEEARRDVVTTVAPVETCSVGEEEGPNMGGEGTEGAQRTRRCGKEAVRGAVWIWNVLGVNSKRKCDICNDRPLAQDYDAAQPLGPEVRTEPAGTAAERATLLRAVGLNMCHFCGEEYDELFSAKVCSWCA